LTVLVDGVKQDWKQSCFFFAVIQFFFHNSQLEFRRVFSYLDPMHPSATHSIFARGFPPALEELRALPENSEPDLSLGLFGLLRASGMNITACAADVLCGHAGQFLYAHDQPDCAQLSFVPPVETLFRAIDVTWKEVTPSGPHTAFTVLRDWITTGHLCLARFKEPILVFGYVASGPEHHIVGARLTARLVEESISLSDCDTKYWRYPLDEGNVLICVEAAPRDIPNLSDLARITARRTVRAWHTPELAGCFAGDAAYRRLASDLADPDVDFHDAKYSAWMGVALWRQWTSRANLAKFFDGVAPRYGGADRCAFNKASFCFGQCFDAWQKWAQYLGPTWNHARHGFNGSYPDDFLRLWANHEIRTKAAHWVEEARGWEEKAVVELTKVIR
jgi:hypothetical protein